MTNINCAVANCVFQKDGKCCYEFVGKASFSNHPFCAYFKEKDG